ncbi:MAG: Hsp20 family protein [Candidatus Aminicenantes bacterium]|nr:Hsp20 family protein [Candidatus Aminicenantes bacterium]
MAIIRWDPYRDLVTLREKMNRLFEDSVSGQTESRELSGSSWTPAVDIYETEHEIVLSAEVPGIDEQDIEIKVEENTLTLRGERKFEKETQEENFHRIERAYGSFFRSFSLPNYVDQEKIKAEHEHGVLKVFLPKKLESKPRKVTIVKPEKKVKTINKVSK